MEIDEIFHWQEVLDYYPVIEDWLRRNMQISEIYHWQVAIEPYRNVRVLNEEVSERVFLSASLSDI
jgi:hypothetical protein